MSSDADYASFLDKANQDPNAGSVSTADEKQKQKAVELKATQAGVSVPTVLKRAVVDAFYTSDADEPFEVVGLGYDGRQLPTEAAFAELVNHPSPEDAEVSILDVAEWDPNGEYKELVDAVREAAKGNDVRVYRVAREKGGSRVEYWVVAIEGGRLLGVKALGVES